MVFTNGKRQDIKAELDRRGLTQEDAASRTGISGAQLSRLLSGQRKWSMLTARAFAMATGIPLSVILPNGPGTHD